MNIINVIENIHINRYFSFVRYQDGEIIAMIKHDWINDIKATENKWGNIDGHLYFDEMCDGLYAAVCSEKNTIYSNIDKYIFRIDINSIIYLIKNVDDNKMGKDWWTNKKTSKPEVLKMLYNLKENIKVKISDDSINSNIYSNPTKIIDFINILNIKNTIIIGPQYLKDFKPLTAKKYINIPLKNCFLKKDSIMQDILDIMEEYENKNEGCIFLFSASMATNYMIDKLFERSLDKHTMIDTGSLFDNFFSSNNYKIPRRYYNPDYIKEHYPSNYWIE